MTPRTAAPALDPSTVETAVTAAVAAPSILNSQPWRFHVTDGRIDVFAVPERAPGLLDGEGREVMLSLGAAVENLRIALTAAGVATSVELVPSAIDRRRVATVRVVGTATATDDERALAEADPAPAHEPPAVH